MRVIVNGKFFAQRTTGVQRFGREVVRELLHLIEDLVVAVPKNAEIPLWLPEKNTLRGSLNGIAWEQLEFPLKVKTTYADFKVLSLCNSAPLILSNQFITIHDLAFLRHPKWFSTGFRLWYNLLIPRLAKRAQHIFTVSQFSKAELISLLQLPESRISITYNGITKSLKTADQLDGKKKIILCVGSVDPRKNLEFIVECFEQAVLSDWKLVIVGATNSNFNHVALSAAKHIELTGYISDNELNKLYQEASIFISASHYEGFGIPVIEAAVAQCNLWLSNIEVYQELFPTAGAFFSPTHEDELVSLFKSLDGNTLNAFSYQIPPEFDYHVSAKTIVEQLKK